MSSRMANLDARTALAGGDERYAEAKLDMTVLPLYSDMLSPVSQPQMPPRPAESYHRSRLDMDLRIATSDQAFLHGDIASLRARRPRQEGSPIELRTPGAVDLFEGMENYDESTAS